MHRKILEGYYFSYLLLQKKPGQILVQNDQAGFFFVCLFVNALDFVYEEFGQGIVGKAYLCSRITGVSGEVA